MTSFLFHYSNKYAFSTNDLYIPVHGSHGHLPIVILNKWYYMYKIASHEPNKIIAKIGIN
jgi:hypothetical protein